MKNRNYWSNQLFKDSKKLPYGFARSGVFTQRESQLLERHGCLLKALVEEKVFNPNETDLAIAKAIREGRFEFNELTQVWHKYITYNRRLISIGSGWSERNESRLERCLSVAMNDANSGVPILDVEDEFEPEEVILKAG
ncbi:DUF413 domain-containing protein [Aliikangiella sp. IMCC44653]